MRYKLLLGLLLLLVIAGVRHAGAHDWYPAECCSGQDCAPVDEVAHVAAAAMGEPINMPPLMVLGTRHGTVVVPPTLAPRLSKDGKMHACISHGRLLCWFLPPSN